MSISDEELMARIQKNDKEAFNLLVRRWEKPLFDLCYRMLNDVNWAEDVRQDVYIKLYRKRRKFKHKSKFSTWIYRMTVNQCLDELSRKKRSKEVLFDMTDSDYIDQKSDKLSIIPENIVEKNEVVFIVRKALKKLPDEQRTAVILRHYENLKFREIAEIMKCPVSTVKSRMCYAMERLNQILSKEL